MARRAASPAGPLALALAFVTRSRTVTGPSPSLSPSLGPLASFSPRSRRRITTAIRDLTPRLALAVASPPRSVAGPLASLSPWGRDRSRAVVGPSTSLSPSRRALGFSRHLPSASASRNRPSFVTAPSAHTSTEPPENGKKNRNASAGRSGTFRETRCRVSRSSGRVFVREKSFHAFEFPSRAPKNILGRRSPQTQQGPRSPTPADTAAAFETRACEKLFARTRFSVDRPTDLWGGGRPRGPVTRHEREHRGADACACVAGIRDRRRAARAATRYDSGFPRRASRRAASPVGLLRSLSGTNDGQPAGCDSGGASWRSRHRGEGFGQLAKQPYREKQPYGPRLAGATPRRRVRPQLAIAAPRRRVSVAAGDRDTEAKSSAAAGDRDTEAHGSATAGDRDIEAQGSATAGGRDTEAAGSATAGDRDSREGFRHGCQSRHRGEGFGRPRLAIATPRRRVRPRLAIATTRRRVPSRPSVATPRRMVRSRMTIATPRRRVPSQPAAATRSVECRMCRRKFSRAVRVSDGGRGRGRSVCVCRPTENFFAATSDVAVAVAERLNTSLFFFFVFPALRSRPSRPAQQPYGSRDAKATGLGRTRRPEPRRHSLSPRRRDHDLRPTRARRLALALVSRPRAVTRGAASPRRAASLAGRNPSPRPRPRPRDRAITNCGRTRRLALASVSRSRSATRRADSLAGPLAAISPSLHDRDPRPVGLLLPGGLLR